MSTAIEGVSSNLDNPGRNVHHLGLDLRHSVTGITRAAGDTLNAVNNQTNNLAVADPNAAARPPVRPKDPPKLPTTTFGTNHADWIHRVPHMIRAWNPTAHSILTDWSLSFDQDDAFILPPEHYELNQIVYDMISAAVTGRARAHLSSAMQKWLRAEARNTVAPDLLAQLPYSAALAWRSITDADGDEADKYLSLLQSTICRDVSKCNTHLSTMSDWYARYCDCSASNQIAVTEPILSDALVNSLPDSIFTAVSNMIAQTRYRDRTFGETLTRAAGSPVAILILVGSDGPQGMALPDVSVTLPDVSNF